MNARGIGGAVAAAVCAALLAPGAPARAAADDYSILIGDLRNHTILEMDPAVPNWNSAAAVKWEWAPTAARGFSAAELAGFRGGNDFRLRRTATGAQRVVVVDGAGLATVIGYGGADDKKRIWAHKAPAADNRHSIELLPDGNVAVAATGGSGYVRVYAASQGPSATAYGEYVLAGAHATLWDPQFDRLWVAGDVDTAAGPRGALISLEVGGPASAPVLREDRRVVLDSQWAHDVSAHESDPAKLWVTTNARTYLYDKVTGTFAAPGAAWDRPFVKAVGSQPSGQVVQTMVDVRKNPQGACYLNNPNDSFRDWCTETVDFFGPDSRRTRSGAAIYKARVMSPYYSVADEALRGRVRDVTRNAAGAWAAPTAFDNNANIRRSAAAATPDGRLHAVSLVHASGVWYKSREASGTINSAAKIDDNTQISEVAIAADADGNLHVFTLVPGGGVWYRKRTGGVWAEHSTQIDQNGSVSAIAATVSPSAGTVHVLTVVPGSGVWHRTGSTAGVFRSSAKIDENGTLAGVSAAALPDGTVHAFTVTHWGSVFHRVRTAAGAWQSSAAVPTRAGTGQVTALAAAGWPGTALELVTVRSGLGLWHQARGGGTWPSPTRIDGDASVLDAFAVPLTDGTLHVGKISEIS
ncbi:MULTISPECIES: DUF6528 family protein [Catenuloplanes]|uniref:Uncharacterized protein n=1 Tax=Catenuloplanes niger TaxID=587534 RepID=A0AAE4CTW6_9ACTN|nr:DUF6528 family protein [Catenuloplanes niger]MDR7321134.1 hypothetical protein [Catenuloplanes niger]